MMDCGSLSQDKSKKYSIINRRNVDHRWYIRRYVDLIIIVKKSTVMTKMRREYYIIFNISKNYSAHRA